MLTKELVIEIKKDINKGLSSKEIANRYGVSDRSINKIRKGETWAEVVVPDGKTWKLIDGLDLEVNELGEVRNATNKRIKKPSNNKGYLKVDSKLVHRLVMEAFVGKSPLQVNHKDGNKLNNRLDNLEYVTARENIQHAVDTGLIKKGSQSHRAVLDEEIVREIKIKLNNGYTQQDVVYWLEDYYGIKVSRGLIGLISTGARWSQVEI